MINTGQVSRIEGPTAGLTALGVPFSPPGIKAPLVADLHREYEGLLESSLSTATGDLALDTRGNYVPAGDGREVVVPEGAIYFHNRSGARKSTGSYFTKDFAVEHLLDRALEAALDEHTDRLTKLIAGGDDDKAGAAFFDFRCADLAMGSGHFLVAAVDDIEKRLAEFLDEHPIPAVEAELDLLRAAAIDHLGDSATGYEIERRQLLRRQVARRCVYGVDRNHIAAEVFVGDATSDVTRRVAGREVWVYGRRTRTRRVPFTSFVAGSCHMSGLAATARRATARELILVAILGLLIAGASAQPATATPRTGESVAAVPVASAEPGGQASLKFKRTGGGKGGIAESIAGAVAGMAAKSFAGFVLNKAGLGALIDGNQTNFDALKTQLDGISNQITEVQKSLDTISGDLSQVEVNQFTIPLEGDVNTIQTLYNGDFTSALVAAVNYAQADRDAIAAKEPCVVPGAKTKCSKALDSFVTHRNAFFAAESTTPNQALNGDIHRLLMPGTSGDSGLIAYGRFLMRGKDSTGFLTAADSNRLFTFYDYFSSWEAVAAWMKAEYLADFDQDQPSTFTNFVNREISGPCPAPNETARCGFFDLEQRELPARIPADTAISLPLNSANRTSTLNQSMWLWDDSLGANLQWDPSAPAGTDGSVPAALETLNTTATDGFNDWRVPSKHEWDGLFGGRSATFSDTGVSFLEKVLPDTEVSRIRALQVALTRYGGRPYVWTSEPTPGKVACVQNALSEFITVGQVTGYAHTALPVSASLANYPGQFPLTTIPNINLNQVEAPHTLNTAQALQYCRNAVAAAVTKGFATPVPGRPPAFGGPAAQLIATRSTTVNYMPVAVPVP